MYLSFDDFFCVLIYQSITITTIILTAIFFEHVSVNSIFPDFPPYASESIQDRLAAPLRKDRDKKNSDAAGFQPQTPLVHPLGRREWRALYPLDHGDPLGAVCLHSYTKA